MDSTIIAALIGAVVTIFSVWYANRLAQKNRPSEDKPIPQQNSQPSIQPGSHKRSQNGEKKTGKKKADQKKIAPKKTERKSPFTCASRMLLYDILAILTLVTIYVVGSMFGWPIVDLINGLVADFF